MGKTDSGEPAGTYAGNIFERLLIDVSWNSSLSESFERDILSLHEGNIARHRIRVAE